MYLGNGPAMTTASRTCLIIDDDIVFATFVQRVATGLGLSARVLTDPRQVEASLAMDEPDVITLDMDMPRRHGLDVLKALSARQLDQRVIIISGTPPALAGEQQVCGCTVVAVLTKPARKPEIEAAISRVLGPAALHQRYEAG